MKLALGTAQLGTDYGIQGNGKPDPKEARKLLDAALELGISLFDTAADYGDAEVLLGDYLAKSGARDSARVVTKLRQGVLDGVPEKKYEAVLEQNIEQSMHRLKSDRLDGLLFHNAEYVFRTPAVEALIGEKYRGAVNRVGVSVYAPAEAEAALAYDGLDVIEVPYNVLDRRLDRSGFFRRARERGMTIFARSSLLQGLLTMPPERLPDFMGFAAPYVAQFQELCGEVSLSPLECAAGFAAAHPYIDYLIFGADSVKQLEEYARAARKGMDPEAYRLIFSEFQDVPERVVTPFLWRK
ncbi:Aldo/keto reductase family protein [Caprobacter fermentans]|uniref:Aldo/keto reductase family protein n=1 Tax=Caproicibacter fermentans TaxID=2576756 RepID=A0A6N8HVS2_9FIRM|nr:aldo/keto reductase [Caproicibacter fermentans]MVB09695.1 Aldo/keto reductase family protein [Caproicibacter fermentans]